jgi:hypothetical protein
MLVALGALAAAESCYAQVSGLQEVLRFDGAKDNQMSGVSILRANQHGVAVSLTRFGSNGAGSLGYLSNSVIAITERGTQVIDLGSLRCPQSVIWGDSVYSVLRLTTDTVFVATSLVDKGMHFYVDSGGTARRGQVINNIDGSLCLYDSKKKILVWREPWGNPTNATRVPELEDIEMFSLRGDVYLVSGYTNYMIPYDTQTSVYFQPNGQREKFAPTINVTILEDSVVWMDLGLNRWSVSMQTGQAHGQSVSADIANGSPSAVGRYGCFTLCSYKCDVQPNTRGFGYYDSLVVLYQPFGAAPISDIIKIPNIIRWGYGIGWWKGAFYFTIEVIDSASPKNWDSTITILYKYTEPTPTVSVSDEVPNYSREQFADRLMFTNEAYRRWLSSLGPDVSVYDVLGNAIPSNEPLTGIVCVRSSNKLWLVSVVW